MHYFKRIILSIILASVLSTAFADTNTFDVKAQIDSIVQPYMDANKTPGVAVAIYFDGQPYLYNYGYADVASKKPVTTDTIFDIASITKVFTATMIAEQRNKQMLRLDDHIVKFLPKLSYTQNKSIDHITLLNLLTHTSSLPRELTDLGIPYNNENDDLLVKALLNWKAPFAIGTQFVYSNVGYGLLGEALENVTGTKYPDLVNEKILTELNMHETVIDIPASLLKFKATGYNKYGNSVPPTHSSYLYGSASMRSSSADMMNFLQAMLGIGTINNYPNLLNAITLTQEHFYPVKSDFVMGLAWQRLYRYKHIVLTKDGEGDGFNSFIGFSKQYKFGVVVLTNIRSVYADEIGTHMLDAMIKQAASTQ